MSHETETFHEEDNLESVVAEGIEELSETEAKEGDECDKDKENVDDVDTDKEDDDVEIDDEDDDEDDKDEELTETKAKKAPAPKKVVKEDINVEEDIRAILGPDANSLSDEFKSRVKNIFEAAVLAAANKYLAEAQKELAEEFESKKAELEAEYAKKLDEAYEVILENVDGYLTKAVDDWYTDNEVKVVNNIRAELVESFIGGLKNLLEEHYIDVPDDKVDVVAELVESNSELESKLEAEINRAVELSEQVRELKKKLIVENVSRDLSEAQKAKLEVLAEGMDYDDAFEARLVEIKKAYIDESVNYASVEDDNEAIDESLFEEVEHTADDDVVEKVVLPDFAQKYLGKKF